jgi:OmpA-OmpF porin, OOP family
MEQPTPIFVRTPNLAGVFLMNFLSIRLAGARTLSALALCITCSALISPAGADEILYAPDYVSVLPGYAIPSKAYDTTGSGFTMSGIYGRVFAPHFAFEVNIQGSVFETGKNKGTDYYQNGATGDLVYLFGDRRAAAFTPFVLAGVGAVYDDFYPRDTRAGAAFVAEAGLGLVSKPLFSNGIRLRFDARYVHDAKEGGHPEGRLLAGIDIPLGRIERHVEYLPGKTEIREVVREVARPWVDSDGDGVDDDHDLCPNTPHGLKVDAHGCAIENQSIDLQGVTFEFNKARLTPNAETVLDLVSRAFSGQPSLKVEIAGHTDSIGSVAANQTLSQLRAEAVRNYLILKGARPDQLIARGYGKSQLLINPENGDRDRERNRRVELRVIAR